MFINGRHRKTSDYSLYWRAGNSIVVQVLSAVFTAIISSIQIHSENLPVCLLKSEKLPRKKSINVDIMPVIRKNYNARAVIPQTAKSE